MTRAQQMPRTRSAPSGLFTPKDEHATFYSSGSKMGLSAIGVNSTMASRMRLDATLNPHTMALRMNNQNLRNELILHKGKIVSNQIALMRTRPPTSATCTSFRVAKEPNRFPFTKPSTARQTSHLSTVASEVNRPAPQSVVADTPSPPEQSLSVQEPVDDFDDDPQLTMLLRDGKVEEVYRSIERSAGGGIEPHQLPRALAQLGLDDVDAKKVQGIVRTYTAKREHLDLDELAQVVLLLERERNRELRASFHKIDSDCSGTVSARELRYLLWDRGFTVSTEAVQEILLEVDANRTGQVDFAEFAHAVRIVNERKGFTQKEAKTLFALFDRYDADASGQISPDELAGLLGYFGAPTSINQAARIVKTFDVNGDGVLGRQEFLAVMRIRLEEEISSLRTLFAEFDQDQSGTIDRSEVVSLIHGLNYSAFPDVIDEALEGVRRNGGDVENLVFEDILHVVHHLREREGFTRAEVEELIEVFNMHEPRGVGSLREFELHRALTWLGYPLSHQRRRQYWCKVDVDKSDSVNEQEFLKYVRLLREDETTAAKAVLAAVKEQGGTAIREAALRDMLNKLGYAPPPALIAQALFQPTDTTGDGFPDLLGILGLLRFIREGQVQRLRQCAGLPDHLALKVQSKFSHKIDRGKTIEPAEVEKFMHDIFKNVMHDPLEQERIRALIQEHSEGGGLLLKDIFWVVRIYDDKQAEDHWRREQEAAAAAGFNVAQVAQFRSQFVKADVDGSGYLSESEIQEVFDDVLSLSISQIGTLQRELQQMRDAKENIDFPEFLRLMRVLNH
eukprot:CAMPEP_0117548830 /NCGR_PEP_ID=MMETSP0784-20121206/47851_1 /TAXON_ID=39447 /ORGANISM="" /LENGTH=790 /DNA_ID=CAMNT_0005345797 /DNA_START=60 /DNA_END=2429 /DNA_ORIENTATION=+